MVTDHIYQCELQQCFALRIRSIFLAGLGQILLQT